MFGRRRKAAPPVISIRDDDPAADVARLEPMLKELNEVIEMLWMEVEGLRQELAHARAADATGKPNPTRQSVTPVERSTFDRPPTRVAPGPTGDVDADRRTLSILVDDLNGSAETLWYESQWVRGQLANVLEDMRGLSDTASTWRRRDE